MNNNIATASQISVDDLPDRIRWDITFDAERLQKDVYNLFPHLPQQEFIYYNVVPLRGAQSRANPDIADFSDPKAFQWGDNSLMEYCPYIKEVSESFGAEVTQVRLMRLEGGAVVKEHTDPTLDACHRNVIRLTVPIFSDDNVIFQLNGTPVAMEPGEVWYMRLSDPHAVFNNRKEERINMSIDLVYNEQIEEKLFELAGMKN